MKRSKVMAAAVSGLTLIAVVVVAFGLNLTVLRAGRSSAKAVSVAAPTTTTRGLPTVVTTYVDDPVPVVIPSNMSGLASAAPPAGDTTPPSAPDPPPTGSEPPGALVNVSASEPGPPTVTSVAAEPTPATSVSTSPPPTSVPPTAPTTARTTTTLTTTPLSSSTTTVPAPTTLMVFDLPRQAGTADIGVGSNSLTLESVELAGGWRYSCERPYGREIQLQMSGPAGRYEFTIKLEGGRVYTEGG